VRPVPATACHHLLSLERRARAFFLHWIASIAAIDEAEQVPHLEEPELAALAEAITRARQAGR
jgi:hypothetical protein